MNDNTALQQALDWAADHAAFLAVVGALIGFIIFGARRAYLENNKLRLEIERLEKEKKEAGRLVQVATLEETKAYRSPRFPQYRVRQRRTFGAWRWPVLLLLLIIVALAMYRCFGQ